jgi:beta-glucanase (GH16 family)
MDAGLTDAGSSTPDTQGAGLDGAGDSTQHDAGAPGADASDAALSDSTVPGADASDAPSDSNDSTDSTDSAADASGSTGDASTLDAARPGWNLVWHDEFDGPQGTQPDSTKWTMEVNGSPANGELEYYTDRPSNVALDGNGDLVITALQESYMGADYTSGRINTAGKFEQAYGRFEARMKLPFGQGLWPAFWALGNNIADVKWPACGEIDIMENVGRDPSNSNGFLHGPGYSGSDHLGGQYTLAGGFSSDFHVFAAEWEQNVVRFYVDDNLFDTTTSADLAARDPNLVWVFDHPFFIILNVAVGGGYPGNPDNTTTFPQLLTVDYVRVYSR